MPEVNDKTTQRPVSDTPADRLEILRDMRAWSEAHPPENGWHGKVEHIVHLHPHVRLRIAIEHSEIGCGLVRSEDLAGAGVFCAELDSEQFAGKLMEVLGPELSRRNLQHLAEAVRKLQQDWP